MSIVVFGSINMDLVARTPRLPAPGETLTGYSFTTVPGGKGANQAVACARLGAATQMVGRVGRDVFGDKLVENLKANSVDTSNVLRDDSAASGVALIAVDDLAENTIIVIPGANGQVGPDEIDRLSSALKSARILLLQLEIPIEMVIAAARMAHGLGVTVILDPAPAQVLPEALYACVDVLTPNQTEAARLAGFYVGDIDSTERAALVFLDWGVRNVIIKMGDQGVYSAQKNQLQHIPAFPVKPVDTVAAGDAFNGALAAAMAKGCSFDEALRWGLAGGALAVTKAGAQTAMPDRAELIKFLEAQSE